MGNLNPIYHNMTMTGLAMFVLGMITMIPEIYFSGIIVTALSLIVEVKDLEKKRIEAHSFSQYSSNDSESYSSW